MGIQPARVEPKFPLLVVESPGPSPGEECHGQANRRTADAHLLGRVRREHHLRRNPASLKKAEAVEGHARGALRWPRGGPEAVMLGAYGG
jgi:hypothetical protein